MFKTMRPFLAMAGAGLMLTVLACSQGGGKEEPAAQQIPPSEQQAQQQPPQGGQPPAARTLAIPQQGSADPSAALPPGHPPLDAPTQPAPPPGGAIPPPPPGSGTGANALQWTVPAGWVTEQPSSNLRRAQYRVPGPAGDAECIVFYFGPNQGGDPMSNAARWASQFKQPDGRSPEEAMKTSLSKVGALQVLQVEVTGTYAGGMTMSAAPAEDKPGHMLLGAVAEGPDSNWFFKFTGPEATVKAQRGAFEKMLQTLKPGA